MTSRPSQQQTGSTRAKPSSGPPTTTTDPTASASTSATGTMRAIVQDRYGDVDALRLEQTDRPEIAEDEVLVRVHAAGMDRGTWHLMTGRPYLMRIIGFGVPRPQEPGSRAATSPARWSTWGRR